MSKVRVGFLGTPAFALVALEGLLADEHFEVVGVVSQPDRPAGRKMKLQASPVKLRALEENIPVLTPEKLNRDDDALETLESWRCDIFVVVAFGQILSEKVLNMPTHGAVNLHGSLLPRWRGAAPIQRAIEEGDVETGVALQVMVKELDAGDVLGFRRLTIEDSMNAMDVHDELARLGVELLHVEMMDYVRGNLTPRAQDPNHVTYARKLEKSECEIDWSQSARSIFNKMRAFKMGPGVYTTFRGKKLKLHESQVVRETGGEPGRILEVGDLGLHVGTGQGVLTLLEVQPESKKRMATRDFLVGNHIEVGDRFGG